MKMRHRLFYAAMLFGASCVGGVANAQSTIDTTGGASFGEIGDFGIPDTATYGQTFTAGSNAPLTSFTLYLNDGSQTPLGFKAYVYEWDGAKATGSALYSSGVQTYTSGADTPFTFNTGNVALTSGNQYVAFLSTSGLQGGQPNSFATMPSVDDNTYTGGTFVYDSSGNDFSTLTTTDWDGTGFGADAYFMASFGSVAPEPASWALMILGFGIAGTALRRRDRVAPQLLQAA